MRKYKKAKAAFQPAATKRPVFGASPSTEKRPAAAPFTSSNDEYPSWRIGRLELVDPFGWRKIDAATILTIREKLAHFESMTWNDILVKSKKQNHTVPITRLVKSARDRLDAIKLAEDELVSLHLSGTERVWGYRTLAVMHVLWWDPKHQVCPSLLKNT